MRNFIWLCVLATACGSDPNHPVDAAIDSKPVDAKIPVCGDGIVDVGEQCDDHNTTPNDGCTQCMFEPGVLQANWSIKTTAGATVACPATFDTAAVYSQPVDAQGNAVGSPIIDLFNCVDGTGTTATLPGGPTAVHIEITNTNNTLQYASSVTAKVSISSILAHYTASILTDGGYFQFAWNLVKASNAAPLTCADVAGINGIESVATDVSNASNSASDVFTCADGTGITAGFLAATYTVSIDALNTANQAIGTAPTLTNKVILAPNKVTDLGTVTIPITAL